MDTMPENVTPRAVGKRRPPLKGGSRKGIPNKVTADVRSMVLGALDKAGGADYLLAQAKKKNPIGFLALVGKCIPKDLNIKADLTLTDMLREVEENRKKRGA